MSLKIKWLPEPLLDFGFGQRLAEPHVGLSLFGPYDRHLPSKPGNLVYAIVATKRGMATAQSFFERLNSPIISSSDLQLWPAFPGFKAAFDADLPRKAACTREIDDDAFTRALLQKDPKARAYDLVNLYIDQIRALAERDEPFRLIYCVLPDEIRRHCRPLSTAPQGSVGTKPSKMEQRKRRSQGDLFGEYEPEQYDYSEDFRRQLKARVMELGIPVQLLLESRIVPDEVSGVTPLSDRAWNISVASYYKAGGKPWRLSSAREGVCYIGLAFRRVPDTFVGRDGASTACCAAQMFLDDGDGVVFKGEFGPWFSPETRQFQLNRDEANRMLRGVIDTYRRLQGKPLREIFLHSYSQISDEEYQGYLAACPPGAKVIGIRVRTERRDGLRLFRSGAYPVPRGMLWETDPRCAYLWASGVKLELATYDGSGIPVPLRIDVQHGTADIAQVAADILSLTKLNYNACRLGDALPVTVKFSKNVGEILVSNPTVRKANPQFRFYI